MARAAIVQSWPRNPELEGQILAAPRDSRGYLVYADWLQARGHLLGELIVVQHQLQERPKDEKLKRRERHLRASLKVELFGELAPLLESRQLRPDFRDGFVRRLTLAAPAQEDDDFSDDPEAQPDEEECRERSAAMAALVRQALELPIARFVQDLILRPAAGDDLAPSLKTLCELDPHCMCGLGLRGPCSEEDDEEHQPSDKPTLADLRPLWRALPRLEQVLVVGVPRALGPLDLPSLKSFTYRPDLMPLSHLEAVVTAHWPKLERLTLWFGARGEPDMRIFSFLAPLLEARGVPALRHLGIVNARFLPELVPHLARSKLLHQLRSLELSHGSFDNTSVESLLGCHKEFARLERLDLSMNCLDLDEVVGARQYARLKGLCRHVEVGSQRYLDLDYLGWGWGGVPESEYLESWETVQRVGEDVDAAGKDEELASPRFNGEEVLLEYHTDVAELAPSSGFQVEPVEPEADDEPDETGPADEPDETEPDDETDETEQPG